LLYLKVSIISYLNNLQERLNLAQFSNQFKVEIKRVKPIYTSSGFLNDNDFSDFITKVDMQIGNTSYEDLIIGATHISTFSDFEPFSLSLSMIDFRDSEVLKFLTKDNNNKDILPKDGTYLLPYDYYFNIKVFNFSGTLLFNFNMAIDGQIAISYETSATADLLAIDVKFKVIERSF